MKFLLDTNVVSELSNPFPDPRVEHWLQTADNEELGISCVTLAEVAQGISLLPEGRKRRDAQIWLDDVLQPWFDGRILMIDAQISLLAGTVIGDSRRQGRTMSFADALIAATCLSHDLTLVTRNIKDFSHRPDIRLFNPWA